MKKLQAIVESLLLFGVVYLVYEIMYFGYMFVARKGILASWPWIDAKAYSQFNIDEASLYYVKDHPVEYTLLCWALIMVIILIVALVTKGHSLEHMSIRWLSFGNFLVSLVVGLGLVFIINGVLGFIDEVAGYDVTYIPDQLYQAYDLVFILVTVGVIAPVFEEVFFRGLIMGRLARGFGSTAAVLLSGIVFSISHLNIVQSLFVLPIGLLCGLLVMQTGSVFAGIWLHIIYNVVNIYLAKMDFFQYNSLQLLIMMVFGAWLLYFGMNQVKTVAPKAR